MKYLGFFDMIFKILIEIIDDVLHEVYSKYCI